MCASRCPSWSAMQEGREPASAADDARRAAMRTASKRIDRVNEWLQLGGALPPEEYQRLRQVGVTHVVDLREGGPTMRQGWQRLDLRGITYRYRTRLLRRLSNCERPARGWANTTTPNALTSTAAAGSGALPPWQLVSCFSRACRLRRPLRRFAAYVRRFGSIPKSLPGYMMSKHGSRTNRSVPASPIPPTTYGAR